MAVFHGSLIKLLIELYFMVNFSIGIWIIPAALFLCGPWARNCSI